MNTSGSHPSWSLGIGNAIDAVNSQIRVLHITSGDVWGGAEVQLRALIRELTSFGDVSVRLLLFNHGLAEERFRDIGVEVKVFDENVKSAQGLVRDISKMAREWQPDIVHTHGYKECVLGTVACRLQTNISCLRTVHGSPESVPRIWQLHKRVIRWAENIALRRQQYVIAVSQELHERLSQRLGEHRVMLIDNGIDPAEILRGSYGPGVVQRQPGVVQIGVVGRLVSVKRVDIFLRVCQILHSTSGRVVRGWVIGDGPLMGSLRKEVDSLGISEQVEMTGFVDNVPASLAALDVLLLTSDHEGLPMVLLEAMALGTPVVAHAVGGIPQALDQGRCGTLVDHQEPQSYVDAVTTILENPTEAMDRARKARARLQDHYSAHSSALRYQQLYGEIVAARKGSGTARSR